LADKGYQGAGAPLITPYKGKGKPESQKDANRAHARLRGPGERAIAQLKTWRILRKLRCCPHKAGRLAKAIHVLQDREISAATRGGKAFNGHMSAGLETVSDAAAEPVRPRLDGLRHAVGDAIVPLDVRPALPPDAINDRIRSA